MDIAPQRRLRLLIPHVDGSRAIAVDGDLPAVDLVVEDGEPTSALAARWVGSVGLDRWVVESMVDQSEEDDLGGFPRQAFVETAAASDAWTPPEDSWVWTVLDEIRPLVPEPLVAVTAARLAERRGERPVSDARPAWARSGWFESARDWIVSSFVELGLPEPDAVVQIRHWGASAVMRIDTGADRYWFKATIALFRAEAGVTAALEPLAGGATPRVIAADTDRNWMILEDLGETEAATPRNGAAAVDALVGLQRRMAGRIDDLVAAGCPDRGLALLPDHLDRALRSPIVIGRFGTDDAARQRALARLGTAIESIEAVGFPTTLIHGDLHANNVAATDRGIVMFDWSDACLGSPVVDIGPWASWFDHEREPTDAVWQWFTEAWEREFGIDLGRLDRGHVDTVTGAFHLVSFLRIIETLEPFRRDELIDGLDFFHQLMLG